MADIQETSAARQVARDTYWRLDEARGALRTAVNLLTKADVSGSDLRDDVYELKGMVDLLYRGVDRAAVHAASISEMDD